MKALKIVALSLGGLVALVVAADGADAPPDP